MDNISPEENKCSLEDPILWDAFEGRGTKLEQLESKNKENPFVPGNRDTVYLDLSTDKFISFEEFLRRENSPLAVRL